MERPEIKIPLDKIDVAIGAITFIGLLSLILTPAYYYNIIPDQIPIHFDFRGEPDAFGPKSFIWLLPVIGIFLYVLLSWTSRFPHRFNYNVSVTEENALSLYKNATGLIRNLKLVIIWAFVYLVQFQIYVSFGAKKGLGIYFLPIFLILIFSVIGYYLFITRSTNREK